MAVVFLRFRASVPGTTPDSRLNLQDERLEALKHD
jgi:hypothetical protein